MSRFHSYLNNAIQILETYTGQQPFAVHLKAFFATQKKYGSTDRKQIAILCYDYFRVAAILPDLPVSEKILWACFICRTSPNPVLKVFHPEWNGKISWPADLKANELSVNLHHIFPFSHLLSKQILPSDYSRSFLWQPNFYIRFRPGREKLAISLLKSAGLPLEMQSPTAASLPPSTHLEGIIKPNRDVVVQDFCSQQVLNYLKTDEANINKDKVFRVWDCCAASGGKSILVYDILRKKVQLTVSDIRESILKKLRKRLQQAGVPIHKLFIADITQPEFNMEDRFDIVIADVPCTGSGTWGRTPEQLHFFSETSLVDFVQTQQKIATTAIQHLNTSGLFFYITCSVFEAENEAVIDYLQKEASLQLLQQEYIRGYDKQADTMFVAVFRKN